MAEKFMYIPARLKNSNAEGYVAGTEQIIDDATGKTQAEIDSEVNGAISSLQGQIDTIRQTSPAVDAYTKAQSDAKYATQTEMTSVSGDVSALAGAFNTLSGNMNTLSGSVSSLSGDVNSLSGNMSTVSDTVDTLSGNVSALSDRVDQAVSAPGNKPTINKTWVEMIQLKNSDGFIPGQTYRITDYITVGNAEKISGMEISGYAGHPFDVIVTALTSSTLSEEAGAAVHSGDTYFADCKLQAWKLRYVLDPANDSRFVHDTAGDGYHALYNSQSKGWIYWMEDEHLNSANYDFKNILVQGVKVTGFKDKETLIETTNEYLGAIHIKYIMQAMNHNNEALWDDTLKGMYTVDPNSTKNFYLFSYLNEDGTVIDASVKGVNGAFPVSNKMSEVNAGSRAGESESLMMVPELNLFVCDWEWTAEKGVELPAHNTFAQRTWGNTFGNRFKENTFYNWTNNNVFGNQTSANIFNFNVHCCIFGNVTEWNFIQGTADNVVFGTQFIRNTIVYITDTTFGVGCMDIDMAHIRRSTIGDYFQGNRGSYIEDSTFGDYCLRNNFGAVYTCTFGNHCEENRFPLKIGWITAGNYFDYNRGFGTLRDCTFGDGCRYNSFGVGESITFGKDCQQNFFHGRAARITIGDTGVGNMFDGSNYDISMGTNCSANHFCHNTRWIIFGESADSLKGYYQGITVGALNDHIILNGTSTLSGSNRLISVKIEDGVYRPYLDNSSAASYEYKVINNGETEQHYVTTYTNSNSQTINV